LTRQPVRVRCRDVEKELSSLDTIRVNDHALSGPLHRLQDLARQNQDEAATRVLIEEVLPRQNALRNALGDVDVLQQKQNLDLQLEADSEFTVAVVSTAVFSTALSALVLILIRGEIKLKDATSRGERSGKRRTASL
jgi:hypothetical protein